MIAIAVGIFLTGVAAWATAKRPVLVFAAPLLYGCITKIMSVAYIADRRVYISETGIFSEPGGAATRTAVLYALMVVPMVWISLSGGRAVGATGNVRRRMESRSTAYIHAGAVLLVLAQTINVVLSGQAFGRARHTLWQSVPFPGLELLLGTLVAFAPLIAGMTLGYGYVFENRALKTRAFTLIGSYGVFLLASGQEFHGFLLACMLVVAPLFLVLRENGLVSGLKAVAYGVAGLAVLVSLMAGGLASRGIAQYGNSLIDTLEYRALVLQGGVLYTADARAQEGVYTAEPLPLRGMPELTREIAVPGLAEAFIQRGVNLSGALPASSQLSWGYQVAAVVQIGYGIFFGLVIRTAARVVRSGSLSAAAALAYIWVWAVSVESRGNFESVLDLKFVAMALLLAVLLPRVRRHSQETSPIEPADHRSFSQVASG